MVATARTRIELVVPEVIAVLPDKGARELVVRMTFARGTHWRQSRAAAYALAAAIEAIMPPGWTYGVEVRVNGPDDRRVEVAVTDVDGSVAMAKKGALGSVVNEALGEAFEGVEVT